ncbi:MAG TPA: GFA family protein [Methylomirabilota bacterium]|nr:GFA family protein [Methylomirabilota bacterium]
MTIRRGSCLCGARSYEIEGDLDGVWMCHCSLCRKVSGGNGIAILIVPRERFRWVQGADHGHTYELRPTYSVTRCTTCGSPLPLEEDETHIYLPAGSLDDPLGVGVTHHIFCASKADWDFDAATVQHHDRHATDSR